MPHYHFSALDAHGRKQQGMMVSPSEFAARQQLRSQQLIPLTIRERQANRRRWRLWPERFSKTLVILFTHQLAQLLMGGLPIAQALAALAKQNAHTRWQTVMQQLKETITAGHSLASALAEFPTLFPAFYCATVSAGEQSGSLARVLAQLATHLEQQQRFKQQLQKALIYPSLMFLVSLAILTFLLTSVVPNLVSVFQETAHQLPGSTRFLIAVSDWLQHHGMSLLLLLLLALLGCVYLLQQPRWRARAHHYYLKLPWLGTLACTTNEVRYVRALGLLLEHGIAMIDAMAISAQLVTLLPLQQTLTHATQQVKEGVSLADALLQTGYLSDITLQLIASGEKSSHLSQMLSYAADYQQQGVERRLGLMLTLLEPCLIIAMGGVVIFIVFAILNPIFSMDQFVG